MAGTTRTSVEPPIQSSSPISESALQNLLETQIAKVVPYPLSVEKEYLVVAESPLASSETGCTAIEICDECEMLAACLRNRHACALQSSGRSHFGLNMRTHMNTPFAQTRSVSRRELLALSLAAGGLAAASAPAALHAQTTTGANQTKTTDARRSSPKRYKMRKSINLWAFPYPQRMNLVECLELAKRAGFDAIELNYDLDNDLSPKASPSDLPIFASRQTKSVSRSAACARSSSGLIRSVATTRPSARAALNWQA